MWEHFGIISFLQQSNGIVSKGEYHSQPHFKYHFLVAFPATCSLGLGESTLFVMERQRQIGENSNALIPLWCTRSLNKDQLTTQ